MSTRETEAAFEELQRQFDILRERLNIWTGTDAQVRDLALKFSRMDDDHQAKFFVEVARLFNAWGAGKAEGQVHEIGVHLRTCECSTQEARDWVETLALAVKP